MNTQLDGRVGRNHVCLGDIKKGIMNVLEKVSRSLSNDHKQRQAQEQIGHWKRIYILESDTSKCENLNFNGGDITSQEMMLKQ